MRIVTAALFLGLLAACGDNFHEVQRTDTIEAYEAWVEANPGHRMMLQASIRLEELYLARADEQASLAAYDAYLEKFPEGRLVERAMAEREAFLFGWAEREGTAEAWQQYLDAYPRGDEARRKKAKRLLKVAGYREHLDIGDVAHARVNLAEDPDGPLNGDGFTAEIGNTGDRTLSFLWLTLEYLDDAGRVLDTEEWPVVSERWPVPVEEERKVPMRPGETRAWEWTTGSPPKGWTRARLVPTNIGFAD